MVISLIGKSSSGKSTIAKSIAKLLRKTHSNIVILDGDELRNAIAPDLGFSYEERRESEARRSKLMKLLSDQGIIVICAGLSNYPEWRNWCRQEIIGYKEVYLKVSQNILEKRDLKGVYAKYKNGEIDNVVGYDIEFIEPKFPDIIIENDGGKSPDNLSTNIIDELFIKD